MGSIRTLVIKNIARELVQQHNAEFNADFENNKKIVSQYTNIQSKKMRNLVAGYVTTYWKILNVTKKEMD